MAAKKTSKKVIPEEERRKPKSARAESVIFCKVRPGIKATLDELVRRRGERTDDRTLVGWIVEHIIADAARERIVIPSPDEAVEP